MYAGVPCVSLFGWPRAIVATLRETETLPEAEAFLIEQQHGMKVMASEDSKEGARAFLEKRAPVFRGK